jgi:hypothetical protein
MGSISHMTESTPDWLAAEMPPGYQNRVFEIQRISEELRAMDRFGGLLWRTGPELAEAVHDAFAALGFDSHVTPGAETSVVVKLDSYQRLLIDVSATSDIIRKRSTEISRVFQTLHEIAEDGDRVVLVTNSDREIRPADRPESASPEALDLLRRLGVNIVTGPTVFGLWMLSLDNRDRAQLYARRLHEQNGGVFALPRIGTG